MRLRARHGLERWAFSEYRASTRDLASFRVLLAAFLALRSFPQGREVSALPATFFDPPLGLAALLSGFVPPPALLALHAIAACALLMLLLGFRTAYASVATTLSLLALQSCAVATGKVDHMILLLLCPAIMATSGWGGLWSLDALRAPARGQPDRVRGRWQLAWLALTVTLAMSSAGLAKLYSGWLRLDVSSAYGHAVANAWLSDRHTLVGALLLRPELARGWELLDWATVSFELLAPLTVVRARWLRTWCVGACMFHAGIGLTMDIYFSANVAVYAAFLPWSRVAPPASHTRPPLLWGLALGFGMSMAIAALAYVYEQPWLLVRESVGRAVVLGAVPLTIYARGRRRRASASAAAVRVA